jgi:hypothetical protein
VVASSLTCEFRLESEDIFSDRHKLPSRGSPQ